VIVLALFVIAPKPLEFRSISVGSEIIHHWERNRHRAPHLGQHNSHERKSDFLVEDFMT